MEFFKNLPVWVKHVTFVFVLLALASYFLNGLNSFKNDVRGKDPRNTLSITATGKTSAVPDMAVVDIGVQTQGTTADGVQKDATAKTNKVVDFIKSAGIDKKDINTSQYSINPQYDYSKNPNTIIGYQATQTVTVKIKGVDKSTDKLTTILGGVTGAGANTINGTYLTFDDIEVYKQQARAQALENAKKKAQELADQAGLKLGRVTNISDNGGYDSPPYTPGYGGGMYDSTKAAAPDVQPGEQDITANMTVFFQIK